MGICDLRFELGLATYLSPRLVCRIGRLVSFRLTTCVVERSYGIVGNQLGLDYPLSLASALLFLGHGFLR